jgi:hypothetical protein
LRSKTLNVVPISRFITASVRACSIACVLLAARKALRALLRRDLSRRTLVLFFVAMFSPLVRILR